MLSVEPVELARQLTLMEFQLFRQISYSELYKKAWESPARGPNVIALIQRFNTLSYWVASEILVVQDQRQRQQTLIRFLEVLKHLNELNNFNGIMELTSALNLNYVSRLKTDWKAVPPKLQSMFKAQLELMNPNANWATYRRVLSERQLPLMPFQGVYLTDLTFIDELPTKLENGLINFEKMMMLGQQLLAIRNYQEHPFYFEPVPVIQEWLHARKPMSEEDLIKASKACEPISDEAPLSTYTGEPSPEWLAAHANDPDTPLMMLASTSASASFTLPGVEYIIEFDVAQLLGKPSV